MATPATEPLKLRTTKFIWIYSIFGVVLGLVLIPLGAWMLNHDHFIVPMLLFPLPMTWVVNVGGEVPTFCVLSVLQFPIYGAFVGYGQGVDGLPSFSVGLGVAHAVFVGICFMSLL